MGLVLNKAKRQTIADIINGASIIGLLTTVGIYIYLIILKIIRSGNIGQINELFTFTKTLMAPLPVLALSGVLFLISTKLKIDDSWFSITYEKLGPGALLLVLILCVWVVLPLVGAAVEAML